MSDAFLKLLGERGYLVADGAMGTNLFKRGLETGYPPELWNVEHPERIASVHQEFVDAGCDLILTNSFGGNAYRLKLHEAQDRAYELAKAAAEIARLVADKADRPVFVGGSMGPTGELLVPNGALTHEEAVEAFAEQARGLADGGADFLWVETMSSREEVDAAIEGAQTTGLQVVATMTFDTAGRTMMGVTPEEAYAHIHSRPHHPLAIGANCGLGATENVVSVAAIGKIADPETIIVAKANCGVPEFKNGEFTYTGTPELMADYARLARDAGARIIGGCCGSDGTVMKAIVESLKGYEPKSIPTPLEVIRLLGPSTYLNEEEIAKREAGDGPKRRERRRRRGGSDE